MNAMTKHQLSFLFVLVSVFVVSFIAFSVITESDREALELPDSEDADSGLLHDDQSLLRDSTHNNGNKIVILVYETLPAENYSRSLQAFLDTAASLADVKAFVVGGDSAFKGFGSKYAGLREKVLAVERDTPNSLVLLLDSRDILINVAVDRNNFPTEDFQPRLIHYLHVYNKLTSHNPGSVLVSAEAQCCVAAMCWAPPPAYFNPVTMEREQRACNSGADGCGHWPTENLDLWKQFMEEKELNKTGKVDNPYLNAGMMAGSPRKLAELLDIIDLHDYEDDQAVLSGLLYQFPDVISLDYKQELFGNNKWPDGFEHGGCVYDFYDKDASYLFHKETQQAPFLLHASGKFEDCLDYLTDKLGGVSEARYIDESSAVGPEETPDTDPSSKSASASASDSSQEESEMEGKREEVTMDIFAKTMEKFRRLKRNTGKVQNNYVVTKPRSNKPNNTRRLKRNTGKVQNNYAVVKQNSKKANNIKFDGF